MDNVNVISTLDTYYPPFGRIDMHNHTFFHYIYVYKGNGNIEIDGVELSLTEGYIYLVKPTARHGFEAGDNGMSTIELKFDLATKDVYSKMCSLPNMLDAKDTDVHSILKKMASEMNADDKYANTMEEIKLSELIITLFRINRSFHSDVTNRFSEVIGYINQNLKEEIDLKSLSEIAYMDKVYFLKEFKKHTGITPMRYVKKMRIEKAKSLLCHSDMNITQISTSCGFTSIHHFSNVFKKETGLSPALYKKNSKDM